MLNETASIYDSEPALAHRDIGGNEPGPVSQEAGWDAVKLLYIEDNPRLAGLVAKPLTDSGWVTDVVGSVEEAQAALAISSYDIVLLDLGLPDGDGADVLRALRRSGNATPVVVSTARSDIADRVRLLDAGADDYMVKPFSMEELKARLRAVLRRPQQLGQALLSAGNLAVDTVRQTVLIGDKVTEVPRLELRVLEALLTHQGRLLPRERLEQAAYSMDAKVTPNAVEVAISRLRRRLDANGATVSITAMRGLGYILTGRPGP